MRIFFIVAAVVASLASMAKAETLYGLTNLNQIITFDSNTRAITGNVTPAGFSILGEGLRSIDVRPNTGQLYGLSSSNRLFILDPTNGANVTLVGTLSVGPAGFVKAIDFNPTVDRIRVHGSSTTGNNNLRANPADTSTVITDGSLAFMAGDPNAGDGPVVVNAGYFNSVAGATTTTLYDIEAGNDALVTQNPANAGTLQTVGSLGFDIVESGGFTGFDISGSTNIAYLVGNKLSTTGTPGLTAGSLYQVNLTTGSASLLGPVTGISGLTFRDIAVANAPLVPEPASFMLAMIGMGLLVARTERRRT